MFRQMEKLIELLNEYGMGAFVYEYGQLRFRMGSKVKIGAEPILISKSFGFIKWLVENEKIDVEKVYNNSDYPMVKRDEFLYEGLLMLLSIQDEPINFLLEILK